MMAGEREDFEEWATKANPYMWLDKEEDGSYRQSDSQSAWEAWQGRAALASIGETKASKCDCELGYNGIGLVGRECDCNPPAPVGAPRVTDAMVTIMLREWFGGERYARDYEYLDMQQGPRMRAALEAALSTEPTAERIARAALASIGEQKGEEAKAYCQCRNSKTNPCVICGQPKFIDPEWLKQKIAADGDDGEIGAGFELFTAPPALEPVADWPKHVTIAHDGFSGDLIGSYIRRDGKRGGVFQQDGTNVVHVYGEKWFAPSYTPVIDVNESLRSLGLVD